MASSTSLSDSHGQRTESTHDLKTRLPMRPVGVPVALALLFDIDGTLMDTLDAIVEAMSLALAEVGQPPLRAGELRPLIGRPVPYQMKVLRDMEGPVVDRITDAYYAHFGRIIEADPRLYPGVAETFGALTGRRISTMTTRRRRNAERMLQAAGIAGHFTAIVGGDEVPRPKPAPDLPIHAAKAIDVPPNRAVVVGDAPVDILAGRAAGAWTVAVTYGYGDPATLRQTKPHLEIARFPDLPKALVELDALSAFS